MTITFFLDTLGKIYVKIFTRFALVIRELKAYLFLLQPTLIYFIFKNVQ